MTRLTRTYLAAPAHRERLVRSAAASAADAVYLDLEDAVPPAEKAAALDAAVAALGTLDWGTKTVAVRVNAAGSDTLARELAALRHVARLDAVILPKAEQPRDVLDAVAALDDSVEIELLIETALGLVLIDTLAAAHPSVTALHLGVGDLAASLGARTSDIGASPAGYRHRGARGEDAPLDLFAYPMMRLLVAARAFGLRAIDGPFGAFRDTAGTLAAAAKAAAMGFDGKQVIHPSQIEPTKQAFLPATAEIAQARRMIEAIEDAEREGHGAVTLDGRMIDYANLRMARRILRLAGQEE